MYEMMVILDPQLLSTDEKKKIDKIKEFIGKKGKVSGVNALGKKRFAYNIGKLEEGTYVLFQFEADGKMVPQIERQMKLEEGVVRYLILSQ
ncbi:MAG TPA: 30S ribosomal protein S6 [Patescibacteria group bacterium]|nr:30S ribosomal protein S6 [Patescibacteria group bacterium]